MPFKLKQIFQKIAKRFFVRLRSLLNWSNSSFPIVFVWFSLSAEIPRGEGLACAMIDAGGGLTGLVELAINLNNNSKNKNKDSL